MTTRRDLVLSLAPFDGHPFDIAVETVAELGVAKIEPAIIQGYTDPFEESIFTDDLAREMRRTAERAGLSCVAFSAHVDLGAPGGMERGRTRIRFAAELGASRVVTNAARLEYRASFLSVIESLAREAETAGVVIALENPGDGNPNLIDSAADANRLVAELDSPWIKINYDPGNMLTHKPDIAPHKDALQLAKGLVSLHIKDGARQGDRWRFVALGTGTIDYAAVLSHTDSLTPQPEYSIEIPVRVSRAPGGKPFRDPEPAALPTIRTILTESIEWMEARS